MLKLIGECRYTAKMQQLIVITIKSGSVAVGKNAYVENTIGKQDKFFAFNQTTFNTFGLGSLPQQPDKVVTGVAVGDNTYVRSGGTMVGSHNYRGKLVISLSTQIHMQRSVKLD